MDDVLPKLSPARACLACWRNIWCISRRWRHPRRSRRPRRPAPWPFNHRLHNPLKKIIALLVSLRWLNDELAITGQFHGMAPVPQPMSAVPVNTWRHLARRRVRMQSTKMEFNTQHPQSPFLPMGLPLALNTVDKCRKCPVQQRTPTSNDSACIHKINQ